jgi:uncharacterized Zn-binding protein involved in type VI secretion
MPKIARMDDKNNAGGTLKESGCASTVFANFKKVAQKDCPITPHQPWSNKKNHQPHENAKVTQYSPTVFADGVQVTFVGASNDCGHSVDDNDATVYVPS